MLTSKNRRMLSGAGWCLVVMLVFGSCGWAAQVPGPQGALQGMVVWADNAPVAGCQIKVFDKLDYSGFPRRPPIARDAHVGDAVTDESGLFIVRELPAGKYHLAYSTPGVAQMGDDAWSYTKPSGIARMYYGPFDGVYWPTPQAYDVADGTVTVPEIELVHRLSVGAPVRSSEKTGCYRLQWDAQPANSSSTITIEHLDYSGKLKHPCYGAHEVAGQNYLIPTDHPLYSGRHRFQVELKTPQLHTFARSDWLYFTVPGDVLMLHVAADPLDPTGRTIKWWGSDAIKHIRAFVEGGTVDVTTAEHTLKLPAATESRSVEIRALNEAGNELVPGWATSYWQETTPS